MLLTAAPNHREDGPLGVDLDRNPTRLPTTEYRGQLIVQGIDDGVTPQLAASRRVSAPQPCPRSPKYSPGFVARVSR